MRQKGRAVSSASFSGAYAGSVQNLCVLHQYLCPARCASPRLRVRGISGTILCQLECFSFR